VFFRLSRTDALAKRKGTANAKPLPQRFTLFSANVRGKNVPMVVEAAGRIKGVGTETQAEKDTSRGQINYATPAEAAIASARPRRRPPTT
jgi:hypothetical protein